MRVGLLEDNPAIQDCISVTLKMHGHSVQIYSDGDQFLQAFCSPNHDVHAYDVVVVDLGLAGTVKGDTVIESLYSKVLTHSLGIIVYSGADSVKLNALAKRFPNVIVEQKPIPMQTLLQLISDAVPHRANNPA